MLMNTSPLLLGTATLRSWRKASVSAGARSWPRSSGPCASERAPVERSVTSAALLRAAISPASWCSREASRSRSFQRLQENADGAAASEPGLPGDFILDAELQHLGLARGQHLRCLGDHLPLDAAAGDRAEEIPLPVDGELAADGLRGRAPGLDDGGERHAPALGTPGQCPWNDAWVARAHGSLKIPWLPDRLGVSYTTF